MTKLSLLTLAGLFALSSLASANIGDTYRESVSRYHDPGHWEDGGCYFYTNSWSITEGFNSKGYCNYIMYSKGDCGDLTDREIASFLSTNCPQGYKWHPYHGSDTNPTWEIGNGDLLAMVYITSWHKDSGETGVRQTLRIATKSSLIARGWMNPDGSNPDNGSTSSTAALPL
jgi:hypothetical protein